MVTALKTRNEALSERGVNNYSEAIQTGYAEPGAVLGRLVILKFSSKQQLPMRTLRDIFLNAGLSEEDLPAERSASDAWRLATKQLEGAELETPSGKVKVLVRDWKGGNDPRRDVTLERQEQHNDCFSYASPAAVITFERKGERMAWENRLNRYRDGDASELLEALLDRVQERFEEYKSYVDGEAIYRALKRNVIAPTAPLPMGQGAWLVWEENSRVVAMLSSVVAALNDFNSDEAQSVANIFTVVNTPQDQETLSRSLDATIGKEVEEALERIGKIMNDPTRLYNAQAEVEKANYSGLQELVTKYEARLKKDTRAIDTKLDLLAGLIEDLGTAISKNEAAKLKAKRANVAQGSTS